MEREDPLALRVRPKSLSEFVGQKHILGRGKLLRRVIEADRIFSIILWGPPGSGKTSLVSVIANCTESHFETLNAVTSGVDDIRRIIKDAERRKSLQKTLLLIEEIHRFNKPQQDALLPAIEENIISLIGTTTQNPYYTISSPLLSRSLIFQLKPLSSGEIREIIERAIELGFSDHSIEMKKDALEHLIKRADGDARKALNALEVGVLTSGSRKVVFDLKLAEDSIQKKALYYEKDEHYDTISAFIKSMRGSDPDATLYWLAKMLYSGEDPRFIARRIVIAASEDVGDADPMALLIATSAYSAVESVGMPEARIPLAQAAVYIAEAPKSNRCYKGIEKALGDVERERTLQIPEHIKHRAKGYKSPHNHKIEQNYLPKPTF
jgi:putative ATPase